MPCSICCFAKWGTEKGRVHLLSSGSTSHVVASTSISAWRGIPCPHRGLPNFHEGRTTFGLTQPLFCRVPPCCTWCTSDPHSPPTWILQKEKLCHVQATKGDTNLRMQLFSWCHHALIRNNNHIWKPCLVHSSTNPEHSPGITAILLPRSEHCRES